MPGTTQVRGADRKPLPAPMRGRGYFNSNPACGAGEAARIRAAQAPFTSVDGQGRENIDILAEGYADAISKVSEEYAQPQYKSSGNANLVWTMPYREREAILQDLAAGGLDGQAALDAQAYRDAVGGMPESGITDTGRYVMLRSPEGTVSKLMMEMEPRMDVHRFLDLEMPEGQAQVLELKEGAYEIAWEFEDADIIRDGIAAAREFQDAYGIIPSTKCGRGEMSVENSDLYRTAGLGPGGETHATNEKEDIGMSGNNIGTPKQVTKAEMLDYTSKAVQDCAIIVRAYDKNAGGTPDLRRLVQAREDIRIEELDKDSGRTAWKDVRAGDYIDTTDPTDMRAVSRDELMAGYETVDRYVAGQAGPGTRVLNYVSGTKAVFGGEECTVLNSASAEVNVLFNENDSCGEAVPLEDASVRYRRPDGTEGDFRISTLENVVVGHEDLSASRYWADLSGGRGIQTREEAAAENDFKARMTDEMLRSQYGADQVFPELGETRESVLKAKLESGNPYLSAQAERIAEEARQAGRSGKARDLFAMRDRDARENAPAPDKSGDITDW